MKTGEPTSYYSTTSHAGVINRLFMACVIFLETLGKCTHLSYKQISVVVNLWVLGAALLVMSIAPVIVCLIYVSEASQITALAIYAIVCT